jgi:hypothetical protein
VAGKLHDQVIDQTARLVHFRAGSLSANPLDSGRYRGQVPKRELSNPDRVKIWNSFFHQARAEARSLSSGRAADAGFEPLGGRLSDEQQSILTLLALCTLAVEARANHLIIELTEKGGLSADQGRAAQRLPTLEKSLLLPKFAGRNARIAVDQGPHQAVAEICGRRNALVHVNFNRLAAELPTKTRMLGLFRRFVAAMEDMNVRLGRIARPRKSVLRLGNP